MATKSGSGFDDSMQIDEDEDTCRVMDIFDSMDEDYSPDASDVSSSSSDDCTSSDSLTDEEDEDSDIVKDLKEEEISLVDDFSYAERLHLIKSHAMLSLLVRCIQLHPKLAFELGYRDKYNAFQLAIYRRSLDAMKSIFGCMQSAADQRRLLLRDVESSTPSPLLLAIITEQYEICKWLIDECGADANMEDTLQGIKLTPLQCAACRGLTDICKLLLARGANISIVSLTGPGLGSHLEVIRLLADAGADTNRRDMSDFPPTPAAIDEEKDDSALLLFSLGADGFS